MSAQSTITEAPVFYGQRDDYGRQVFWVSTSFGAAPIGSITRLPKRTFPVLTYMVNDFRITRQPGMQGKVEHVSSLAEAKARFRA